MSLLKTVMNLKFVQEIPNRNWYVLMHFWMTNHVCTSKKVRKDFDLKLWFPGVISAWNFKFLISSQTARYMLLTRELKRASQYNAELNWTSKPKYSSVNRISLYKWFSTPISICHQINSITSHSIVRQNNNNIQKYNFFCVYKTIRLLHRSEFHIDIYLFLIYWTNTQLSWQV